MSHRLDTDSTPIRIARALVVCVLLSGATNAFAQAKPRPSTPPPPPPSQGISINGYAMFGLMNFTAADSFEVVLGEPSGFIFGGGARVGLPLGGLFVDVGAWRFNGDGERVFVNNGQEFPLGIPLEVTITPLELSAGWQFRIRGAPKLRPYAMGGYTSYRYEETSESAASTENVDERFNGFHVGGGAEYRLMRWLGIAGEFIWTTVPDAIGESGVSAEFDETDLGGSSFRFKITIGR